MKGLIHDDLSTVIDAVEITAPNRYRVLGRTTDIPPDQAPGAPTGADTVPTIVAALATSLYEYLYIRPQPLHSLPWGDSSANRTLIAALSRANASRGCWEQGWTIRRVVTDDSVVAARHGIDFRIEAMGLRTLDGPARTGAECHVRVPKELRAAVPGFYLALGDADDDTERGDPAGPGARYYWHLEAAAAVPFVAAATSRLNAAGIPFRLKVADHPWAYRRADAGLIFVSARQRSRARAAIADIYSEIAPLLRADVPLFTRRLADGLGFANDPPGGLSFGQHRCRLVAQALWESFLRGERTHEACAAAIVSTFRQEGLDALRPHLEHGCEDEDPIEIHPAALYGRPAGPPAVVGRTSPFEAAIGIGRAICRSAYWDDEGRHCNWTGRTATEMTAVDGPVTPTLSALGPDVYGGSAGIALFLARLHCSTGDPEFRRTAMGAIANALRLLGRSRSPDVAPLSFFCGDVGVAYTADRVGAWTGAVELAERADALLDTVAVAASQDHVLDVIGGSAGAIPTLLAMAATGGFERCGDVAIALAEDLCRTAIRQGAMCCWEPDLVTGPGMMSALSSGMSHGAAGIGLALLEAYAVTGRPEFRETARGAFAYEDSLFDPDEGNWRDLRLPVRAPAFARGWCHGAPGIALSRLRAAALDPERGESCLAMARAGLATTVVAIEEGLAAPRYDATLVYGLSGMIEILWIAGLMLDDDLYRSRAIDAAYTLIARYAASGDWPSGAPSGGLNPSLMIGTAGIGYCFLRLHDPEPVPSVLWIGASGAAGLVSVAPARG